MTNHTDVIAFYLPQYHPIKENDRWWGQGFTEWTNVAATAPRFSGHYQPHIPADLGFYDLRLPETRQQQVDLAMNYGISGFCYYHYWFNGHMLLERPFNEVLSTGKPDFPFCLCWANENWTRAWDGLDRQILIKQNYCYDDSLNHIMWLIEAFKDHRYIKVRDCPMLLIYRLDVIPSINNMITLWRSKVKEAGFPDLYLCAVKSGFIEMNDNSIIDLGFDAIIDFQPNRDDFPVPKNIKSFFYLMAQKLLPDFFYQKIKLSVSANKIINYRDMLDKIFAKDWPKNYRKFPCLFPSWDNSARRKSATIIQNDYPSDYGKWLRHSIKNISCYPEQERFVFINAWNEWAEGCHLEPDIKNGRAFLEQTKEAISSCQAP